MSKEAEFEPTEVAELLAYTPSDTGGTPDCQSLFLLQLSSHGGIPSAALPVLCLRCTDAYLIFWKRQAFKLSIITHIPAHISPFHFAPQQTGEWLYFSAFVDDPAGGRTASGSERKQRDGSLRFRFTPDGGV